MDMTFPDENWAFVFLFVLEILCSHSTVECFVVGIKWWNHDYHHPVIMQHRNFLSSAEYHCRRLKQDCSLCTVVKCRGIHLAQSFRYCSCSWIIEHFHIKCIGYSKCLNFYTQIVPKNMLDNDKIFSNDGGCRSYWKIIDNNVGAAIFKLPTPLQNCRP